METRYDFIAIKADVSAEGFIRDRPVITRAGIFTYRNPNGKITKEYRPDEEVFAESSLQSLSGVPITDMHCGLVTSDNTNGIVGTVTSPGARQDSDVVADIVIHASKRIGNKRELSLGYQCNIDNTPGEYNGERYDAIQRQITYNHLAVVNKGRAGNARLRLDSEDAVNGLFEQENDMADPKLVAIRLDDIEYQAAPEVINALKKATDTTVDLQKRLDTMEAERDTLKAKVDEHSAEITKVKNTAREELRARLELENTAKQLDIKFDATDTDTEVKRKVVGKLRPTLKLENRSDEYIASAFDFAVDMQSDKKVSNQKQRLDQKQSSDDVYSAETARQKMIDRIRNNGKKEAA